MNSVDERLSFFSVLKRLFPFLRPYSKYVTFSFCLTIVGSLAAQIDPLVLGNLVDGIANLLEEGSSFSEGLPLIFVSGLILLGKGLLILFTNLIQGYLGETLKVKVSANLSDASFNHLLSLGMPFFESEGNETGKLIRRIDRGVEGLSKVVKNILIDIFPLFATAIFGLVVMYSVNIWVGLLASLIIPVYFFLSYKQAKQQEGVRIDIQDLKEVRSHAMLNALISIKVIKSFVREGFESKKHKEQNNSLAKTEIKHHQTNRIFDALKVFSEELGAIAIVLLTSYLILDGQMTTGAILLHLMLYRNVTAPIRHLHRIYDEHNEAVTFAYGYFTLLDTPVTEPFSIVQPDLKNKEVSNAKGEFRLEKVDFGYVPGYKVLRNIDLVLKAGETTALVGLSGAGKTTIANLLVRFYEPEHGHIFLDTRNLHSYPLSFLRQTIGVVLQENHIFHDTILENIRYGNLDATLEEVQQAAIQAQLHDFVTSLPLGYETPAYQLSGGQKQRIALARIFLKNPPVLILDEPTASLDAITTEQIKRALDQVCYNRTVLIISHNISQIINANKIYVIKDGQVVEEGTHESLYSSGGHYTELIDSNIENMNLKKLISTSSRQ